MHCFTVILNNLLRDIKKVVDTTGAGDTFNGALAVALIENKSLEEAVNFANLAASFQLQD